MMNESGTRPAGLSTSTPADLSVANCWDHTDPAERPSVDPAVIAAYLGAEEPDEHASAGTGT